MLVQEHLHENSTINLTLGQHRPIRIGSQSESGEHDRPSRPIHGFKLLSDSIKKEAAFLGQPLFTLIERIHQITHSFLC